MLPNTPLELPGGARQPCLGIALSASVGQRNVSFVGVGLLTRISAAGHYAATQKKTIGMTDETVHPQPQFELGLILAIILFQLLTF